MRKEARVRMPGRPPLYTDFQIKLKLLILAELIGFQGWTEGFSLEQTQKATSHCATNANVFSNDRSLKFRTLLYIPFSQCPPQITWWVHAVHLLLTF